MKKFLLISVFAVLFSSLQAQSAAPDSLVTKIELKDGSILIGILVSEDSLGVNFRTLGGTAARIAHTQIRYKFPYTASTIHTKDTLQQKTVIDPNRTRLFLMPTARPVGSGNGYFSTYELFFPTVAFGLGNTVSLAGGMSIFPGSSNQLLYFAPKVTLLNSPNVSLAVGGLYIGTGGTEDGTSLLYGAATFGNEKSSLTVAVRFPTERDQNSLFVIGGELQTSSSFKLITENWIFSNSIMYSFGFRFFGEKLAADLGFMRTSEMNDVDGFPFFPWLGFAYNFGTPVEGTHEIEQSQQYSHSTYRTRFSFGIFTTTGNDDLKKSLDAQGFSANNSYGGLFSSGDENNKDGNGLMIQVERLLYENFAAGITISTIGEIIGRNSSVGAYKYFQTPYYTSANIIVEHSVLTYGVHVALVSSEGETNNWSYSLGAGIANSDLTTDWRFGNSYNSYSTTAHQTFEVSQLTGLIFLAAQQHITQFISIGVDGSYFFMADTKINGFDLGSIGYKDYSTNPATDRAQIVSVGTMTPNFSYGKGGISLGIRF